jgi:hypothetical protein
MIPAVQMQAALRSWSHDSNRRCHDCELASKCDPDLLAKQHGRMVSRPVGICGFEEGKLEGDSPSEEVAA